MLSAFPTRKLRSNLGGPYRLQDLHRPKPAAEIAKLRLGLTKAPAALVIVIFLTASRRLRLSRSYLLTQSFNGTASRSGQVSVPE